MIFHLNRHRFVIIYSQFCILFLGLTLTACTTLDGSQVQNILPATEIPPPPTPTIIWFPLSATPSPQVLPTKKATPEQKPGVGAITLTDIFSSAALWNTGLSDLASVDVSDHQLTIAVQPGISDISLRQDMIFKDFYAEVTARTSLCRGTDDFGLLFRAPNNVAYYRFSVLCNGTARVDRFSVRTPHILLPAFPSADVPPGAPGRIRLGVWAVGSEFHFFLNDQYQFSVNDKNYPAGAIGVFAQSTGDTPVTVSFSDLVVYNVSYTPPSTNPPHP